jgi:hypothetical protein
MQHKPRLRLAAAITGAAALVLTTGAFTSTHADAGPYPVVAGGLNNPRHLNFGADGSLYIAEAGTGGSGPCMTGGEGGQVCFGWTGSVTKVTRSGSQSRVLTGLASLAGADDPTTPEDETGTSALGPAQVSITGSNSFVVAMGFGSNPANRSLFPANAGFGELLAGHFTPAGWHPIADVSGHEAATNPIDDPDSDPASVLKVGSRYVVADAGGNTVVLASKHGWVKTLAAFPDTLADAPPFLGLPPGTQIPMQAVPTSVVRGPDHAYYISQLTGFPFPLGAANIYRMVPGQQPTVYASGLTNVTDLAFGSDGSLYAVEIASQGLLNGPIGALVKIPAGGGTAATVADGLFAPYGVALRGGSAYVTTGSVLPGGGQVIRIPLS